MRLVCLVLCACALLIPTRTVYADGPWKHLSLSDAIQFAVDGIGDAFTNASKTIIPRSNIADSPMNKFVDALTIEAQIKPILLQRADLELDALDHPGYSNTFVTAFIKRFTYPFLVDAMQQRLLLLDELYKIRINKELKLVMDRIENIVKNVVFDGIDPETVLQSIFSNDKESSISDEIKKTLSYPVVRQEVIRVMSNDFLSKDALIHTVMETLAPFIREGIQNADSNTVNQHSPDDAINGLKSVLIPQYIYLMKGAILKANNLDAILNDSYDKDASDKIASDMKKEHEVYEVYKFARDMEEEYAVLIRQAISIVYVTNVNSSYPDILNEEMTHIIGKNLVKTIRRSLQVKLNIAMGISEPYIVFSDHMKISHIRSSIKRNTKIRVLRECDAYSKVHQTFSKENRTTIAEFAIHSLKNEYKDISMSQIEVLKRNIPPIKKLATYYYKTEETEDYNLSDQIKSFQNHLEKKAISTFDFLPGMFVYSKPYYDVLEYVFSQSFDALGLNHSNVGSKLEL